MSTNTGLMLAKPYVKLNFADLATVITCFAELSSLIINGRKAFVIRYNPFTLTSHVCHQSSGSLSFIRSMRKRPALLTSMSSLPTSRSTSAAASRTDLEHATSSFIFKIRGTGLSTFRAASWTAISVASSLERAPSIIVDAPALAKLTAMARPMPLLAPLISTDRPERSCLVGSMAG